MNHKDLEALPESAVIHIGLQMAGLHLQAQLLQPALVGAVEVLRLLIHMGGSHYYGQLALYFKN